MILERVLMLPDEGAGYAARQKCGERTGYVGIGANLFLFAVKLSVGIIIGVIALVILLLIIVEDE